MENNERIPNKTEKKESICDRRVIELKEAEKTIANKDVIIKMLQEQVKKLEGAYKENLKETESFRYKFYVASEQIKKLRCCPQTSEKSEGENQIKELKSDLAQWKHKCTQLMTCKESSQSSDKCRYVQQIQDIDRIMTSHYDLLQTLVEKILDKNSKYEQEPDKIDAGRKDYDEKIAKLQEEIARLTEENRKLQKKKSDDSNDSIGHSIVAKDSLLETFKRSQSNLQKKNSVLATQHDDIASVKSLVEGKQVSFSRREQSIIPDDIFDEITDNQQEETGKETSPATMQYLPTVETLLLGEEENDCASKKCKKQIQKTELSKEPKEEPKTVTVCNKMANETKTEAHKIILNCKVPSSGVLPKCGASGYNKRTIETKTEADNELNKSANDDLSGTESFESSQMGVPIDNYSPKNDTPDQITVKTRQVVDIGSCPCKTAGRSKCVCDPKKILTQPPKQDDDPNQMMMRQTDMSSHKTCYCITTQTPTCVCDSTESLKTKAPNKNDGGTKSEVNDMQEMIQKLNDIGSRVTEVLEKQVYTCKEIDLLKTELAGSRDTTEMCSKNITKLSSRINEQKLTFLEKFQEHQKVTDNLIVVNGEITKELGNLKDKIEVLFKNIEELNQQQKLCDTCDIVTCDDVITVEECRQKSVKIKLDIDSKTAEVYKEEDCICSEEKREEIAASNDFEITESNDFEALEVKYQTLEEANRQKDKQIKCIHALVSYYKKAHDKVVAVNAQAVEKIENQMKQELSLKDDELDKCIENAKTENLKLKTAISSVIDCFTTKVSELKRETVEAASSTCVCVKNTLSDNDREQFHSALTTMKPQVELEDIYQAVRRTVAHNCRACSCSPNYTVSDTCTCYSSNPSEEDYSCVFCVCASESNIVTLQEPLKCEKHKQSLCELRVLEESNSRNKAHSEDMITNLETYIHYLHEQLQIIVNIENRIEEMRVHVKESKM